MLIFAKSVKKCSFSIRTSQPGETDGPLLWVCAGWQHPTHTHSRGPPVSPGGAARSEKPHFLAENVHPCLLACCCCLLAAAGCLQKPGFENDHFPDLVRSPPPNQGRPHWYPCGCHHHTYTHTGRGVGAAWELWRKKSVIFSEK